MATSTPTSTTATLTTPSPRPRHKVKTPVHEPLVRVQKPTQGLKVKTHIKAGLVADGVPISHIADDVPK